LGFNKRLGISSPSDRLLMLLSNEVTYFKLLLYQFSEHQRFGLKCFLLKKALAVPKLVLSPLVLISCVPIIFSREELVLDVCEQETYNIEVGQVDAL
jgi:hypothetical protein